MIGNSEVPVIVQAVTLKLHSRNRVPSPSLSGEATAKPDGRGLGYDLHPRFGSLVLPVIGAPLCHSREDGNPPPRCISPVHSLDSCLRGNDKDGAGMTKRRRE